MWYAEREKGGSPKAYNRSAPKHRWFSISANRQRPSLEPGVMAGGGSALGCRWVSAVSPMRRHRLVSKNAQFGVGWAVSARLWYPTYSHLGVIHEPFWSVWTSVPIDGSLNGAPSRRIESLTNPFVLAQYLGRIRTVSPLRSIGFNFQRWGQRWA